LHRDNIGAAREDARMWEADALLDAIFDNPDDDTPRLVYADWLQEHDQENYAQFIRLSIKADGGSKPPAERRRLEEERCTFWDRCLKRLEERIGHLPKSIQIYEKFGHVRYDYLQGLSPVWAMQNYPRGFCQKVVVKAEDFVRTVPEWWPLITPSELCVYDLKGHESEVGEAIGKHLPWLRFLFCLSRPGMESHDIDMDHYPPFSSELFTTLASTGSCSKLRDLMAFNSDADPTALKTFADSAFYRQLESLLMRVGVPGTNGYQKFGFLPDNVDGSERMRLALQSFLDEHSAVQ